MSTPKAANRRALLDAQVRDALTDGVANLRFRQKIHQELLHAVHQPRPLEDRLVELARYRVTATMVLSDPFGESFVAIVAVTSGQGNFRMSCVVIPDWRG